MAVKEKKLFFSQSWALNEVDSIIEKVPPMIQAVLDEWAKLSKIPLTVEMIKTFQDTFGRPIPEVVEQILLKEQSTDAGLTGPMFDQDQVLRMMKKPDISSLLEALEPLLSYTGGLIVGYLPWECFTLDGGLVSLNEKRVEELRDRFRYYAETPAEFKRLEMAEAVLSSLESILGEYPDINPASVTIPGLISEDNGRLMVSTVFVKEGRVYGRSGLIGTLLAKPQPTADIKSPAPSMVGTTRHASNTPEMTPEQEIEQVQALAMKRNLPGSSSGVVGKKLI